MKREIKFQAWIPSLNKIIEIGSHLNDTAIWIGEEYFDVIDHFTGSPISLGTDEDGVILMQFTGLKDKNGKEVYDKYIYRNNENGLIGLLTFEKSLGGDILWCDEKKDGTTYNYRPFYELDLTDFEIIGNQFENPELLKP